MRTILAAILVSGLGVLCAGCHNDIVAVTPSTTANMIVLNAVPSPNGLSGFVINSGSPGAPNNPMTCASLVCFQTIQIQNSGNGCAGNVNGQTNVFIAPASSPNLLRSGSSGFLIPGNPTVLPGQVVTVNVTIPEQPAVNYVITEVLNWTIAACPQ